MSMVAIEAIDECGIQERSGQAGISEKEEDTAGRNPASVAPL